MKFFEKLKGKYDLARGALKRARDAEAQVDGLLKLCEEKDERIEQAKRLISQLSKSRAEELKRARSVELELMTKAYAQLKVDADVMRQEIKEYRRRLFEKEQDNAGNDRGE